VVSDLEWSCIVATDTVFLVAWVSGTL